jgi:O-antigen/teichoic acid export membrane protein
MAVGYGLRVVQIAATLIVVPFLLREDAIGIERYGQIFAILSALGVVSLILDGLKVSYSRSISASLAEGSAATSLFIGAGIKAMMGVSLAVAIAVLVWRRAFLGALGIPADADFLGAMWWAAAFVVFDNGLFSVHAHLTARGRLDLLNGLIAIEVVLRNLAFFAWFTARPATAAAYMAIFAGGLGLRYFIIVLFAVWHWPDDFRGWWRGRVGDTWGAVRYSLPVSVVTAQYFVFQRLTIPLVGRFIGPAEAGLLALGLNTISSNLAQILFTVARPVLVPIAARLDFATMTTSTRRLLLHVDSLYVCGVVAVTVPLVAVMPTLIGVWLGPDYEKLVLPAQILVAGTTFQVAFNVQRSILIGQGLAAHIARGSIVVTVLSMLGLAWSVLVARDWVAVTLVIGLYGLASTILPVGRIFERRLLAPEALKARHTLRISLACASALALAAALSLFSPARLHGLAAAILVVSLGAVVTIGHLVVIPASDALRTVQRLRSSARRSLFGEAANREADLAS